MSTTQNGRKHIAMTKAQENLYAHNVARFVCEVDSTSMGTIYNPYTSLPSVVDGSVSSEAYTVDSYSATADTLQVNRRAASSEHVNSYDWKSVNYDLMADRGKNFGQAIANVIDGYVFGNVVGNGGWALGDGGTDGSTTPWTSSNTVIDDIINASIQQVEINNGHGDRKFMVVSPYEANDLRGYLQNSGNVVADNAIERGIPYVGTTFSGVDIFQTNNLRNTVTLGLATNPTDGDTITINGVTLTFKATLGSTAGNVHIGTAVDDTRANLATFLSDFGENDIAEAATTGAVALSAADQAKLRRLAITATNDNGADTLAITANGTLVVSETLTATADAWGTVSRYLVAGSYGSVFLALPTAGMEYEEKAVSSKAGKELFMEQFYNTTIWTRKQPLVGTVLVN